MHYILIGSIVILGLFLLDRLGLWAERRGWVYYRHRRSSGGAMGNAFLELQSFFEPAKRPIIEERKSLKKDAQDSGDPPQGGYPQRVSGHSLKTD